MVALVAAGPLFAAPPTAEVASKRPAAGQLLLLYNSHGSVARVRANARRYKYVVLQPWDTAALRAIKRRNPHAVVLAYQEASAMVRAPGVNGVHGSGVGWKEANAGHPDWFLHDSAGNRITEQSYSYLYMADMGNRGYQERWATNVERLMRRGPWDGVFMDDVNTTAKYHVSPSRIAKYPNDAAYQRATRSFLSYVRPRIQGMGKIEVANMGAWVEYPNVVKDWLQFVDGGMDEVFVKYSGAPGQGYRNRAQWNVQLNEVRTAQAMGKRFFAVTQTTPTDEQARRYGWGSLLLVAGGRAGYLPASNYEVPPRPLAASIRQVGAPRGGAHGAGPLVYRRFSRGLVVVNPDGTPHQVTFATRMSGSGLRAATSTTMGGHTALILHRAHEPGKPPPQRPVSAR